jgi:hypothetical protein
VLNYKLLQVALFSELSQQFGICEKRKTNKNSFILKTLPEDGYG